MTMGRPPKSTARVLEAGELRRMRERRAGGMSLADLQRIHGIPTKTIADLCADLPPANAPIVKMRAKAVLVGGLP